jgi:zinc protease
MNSAGIEGHQGKLVNATPKIEFEKCRLANGLEVILSEDHRLPLVAANIWYHVGPANERPGRTGFAHLFEHMMFQGSKYVGENQIKVLQAAGATDINGTTGFDRTNYFETMPAEKLELALWLESDRMAFLQETLTARNLANQRDVVRNERRERENTPYSLVEEELYRQLFPSGHPYHASIIGSHADIESVCLRDVRDFCRQYYVPNNASLALVGDFDSDEARGVVEKYFGPIPAGASVPRLDVTTPAILSQKRVTVTDRVELPRVYKAWLTASIYQPGDAEADVLAQILGGSPASRLYQKLVYDRQIAQDVSAGHQSLALGSVFMLHATANPGIALADLEHALDDELQALQSSGPTSQELERARNTIQTNFVFGLEQAGGMGGVANHLNGYNHYLGDPGYVAQDWARYDAVCIADVQRAALELGNDASVVILGVQGPKVLYDVPKRTSVETDPQQDPPPADIGWRGDPPKARQQTLPELPVPTSFQLANGLKVLFLEQHHIPAVAASLVMLGGNGANPADLPGLASFTAGMLSRGTAQRSQRQIADDFERLGTQWWAQSNSDASTVSLRVLKKNVDATFEILSDVVLNPAFQPEEIERVRRERMASIVQQRDNPALVAHKELLNALYGRNHPYGYVDIGIESSIQEITRGDLLQFYSTTYAPQGAALVMVGDVTQIEAHILAEKYFDGWSRDLVALQAPEVKDQSSRQVLIVDRPSSPQTQVLMGQLGVSRNHPDYVAIEVMNMLFGGMFSSRINHNLREVHGYTYGANSRFTYRRSLGPFLISGAIRTDATAAAVAEVFHEMDRLRETLAMPEELAIASESLTRLLISRFDTAASSSGSISELFTHDLDPHHFKKILEQISRVRSSDVQRVAKEHLLPESMIVVAVGDATKIESDLSNLNLGPLRCVREGR